MTALGGITAGPVALDSPTLRAELEMDEGCRLIPYVDTRGFVTAGIGHNMTAHGITQAQCDAWYQDDVAAALTALDRNAAWWRGLAPAPARVLVNLTFNMGWAKLATFRRFLDAMQRQDFDRAAAELKASDWWRQVGERGPRMVQRLTAKE